VSSNVPRFVLKPLRVLYAMVTVRYSLSRGYVLTIADLRRVLADVSYGSRRWWIDDTVTLARDAEKSTFWLTIFHSCPDPDQMTDEITFEVPVLFACLTPRNIDSGLVCLHSETIRPLMDGLYQEHDRVVLDSLEDLHMFWEPIKQALSTLVER
jgi:hypothetical protein